MDKSNPKRNIIPFTKTFLSCLTKAEECYSKGALDEALLEANNAYSIEQNAEVLLLLAEIYLEKGCFDLAMTCACRVLALGKMDGEKRERLFLIIPKILIELGQHYASVFYILRHSQELSDVLSKMIPHDQSIEKAFEKELKALMEGDDEEEEEEFVFADEVRERYNQETLNRAVKLMSSGELVDAKPLLLSLYETGSPSYKESRRLLSYIYANENNIEKAVKVLRDEFEKDKGDAGWVFTIDTLGEKYKPLVKEMLEEFEPSERKDMMLDAIKIANQNELHDLAFKFASELSAKYPNNVKFKMLKILAKWNQENSEETKTELLRLLYTVRVYYPVKFIRGLRFPKTFSLDFQDLPTELLEKLNRNVLKAVKEHKTGEDYGDLLTAVIFLLRNVYEEDFQPSIRFIDAIEQKGGQFQIDFYKCVAVSPKIHLENQRYAIEQLVDKCRKGKFFFNNEGFILELTLRVPPSYDDFFVELKVLYLEAFSMMATFDNEFEKELSEIFERAYLKDLLHDFPRKSNFAIIVGYYLMSKRGKEALKEFCQTIQMNAKVYEKHAEKLKLLLNED